MKRLELSVAADADLFDILAYGTAVYGEAMSDAYSGLIAAFDFFARILKPGRSRRAPDLGSGAGDTASIKFFIGPKSTA